MPLPIPSLNLTSWAGLAAAGALLATGWRTVLGFATKLTYLVLGRVVLKEEAAEAVLMKVWRDGSRSPLRMRIFGGVKSYVFPRKRVEAVGYETLGREAVLTWFNRVPVVVKNQTGWSSNDSAPPTGFQARGEVGLLSLWYLRGTLDVDLFIEDAITQFNRRVETATLVKTPAARRFAVNRVGNPRAYSFGAETASTSKGGDRPPGSSPSETLEKIQHGEVRLLTWTPDDLIERGSDAPPFGLYPFTPNQMALLPEIETWLKHEQWFRSKGVPWRRGILGFGPPGGGKTTFIKAVALHFDLPVYAFDLSSHDNESFVEGWQKAQRNAPSIVLLEDLDTSWNGRTYVGATSAKRDHLTFDCLLNTISGVGISDGILLFITTNRVETLDPALGVPVNGDNRSTRPGRIDRAVWFGPMETPQRLTLASFILADYPALITPTVAAGEGEMAAQFQERCTQLALREFWAARVPVTPLALPPP